MGEILNEAFEAVLQSMPARMEAVIKARGGRSTTEPEGGPRTVFFTCNDSLGHGGHDHMLQITLHCLWTEKSGC